MIAPYVLDKAVKAQMFLACVEQALVPAQQRNAVVIMDNLPVHKVPAVRRAIEAAGVKRPFLPPDSPDLSPIEMVLPHEIGSTARSQPFRRRTGARLAPAPPRLPQQNAPYISATADIHS